MGEDILLSKCPPNYFTKIFFFYSLLDWLWKSIGRMKAESSFIVLFILKKKLNGFLNGTPSNKLVIALKISHRQNKSRELNEQGI